MSPVPAGSSTNPRPASIPSRSSASAGASGPARSQSRNPRSGSAARPSTAGRSPARSATRAGPSPPSTSAAAAATTEVPEPPLGDQKQTSMKKRLPRVGGARGTARKQYGESVGESPRTIRAGARPVKGSAPVRPRTLASMEAAFFDLDKTVIATSSVMALGGRFYKEGLISKRTIVRGIYAADRVPAPRRRRREDGTHARSDARAHQGLGSAARRATSCARPSTKCSRRSSTRKHSSSSKSTSRPAARR